MLFTRLSEKEISKVGLLKLRCGKWFGWFCAIHLLLWSFVPYFVRGCIPFDTAENIAWGYQWQMGYNKHPPLSAWVSSVFAHLGGVGIMTYVVSQLAIIVTFWATWQLAKKILKPVEALIAVILLEGVLFFNLVSPAFHATAMMLPVWAISAYVFYLALKEQRLYQWLILGVMVAANFLTKYEAPLLLVPMLFLTLVTREGRASYRKAGIYFAGILAIALCIPHLLWAIHHHYPELKYALNSTTGGLHTGYSALNHIAYPIRILADELGTVLLLFIMAIPFFVGTKSKETIGKFNWSFLLWIGFAPFALTLLYSIISGSYLDPNWCTAYYFPLGIIVMAWLRPVVTKKKFKPFLILVIVFGGLVLIGRYGDLTFRPYITGKAHSTAYFPAKKMTKVLASDWQRKYQRPLKYVGGAHYLVAYVSAYDPNHPQPYFNWSLTESFWIDINKLRKNGALFLWRLNKGDSFTKLPKKIKEQFPSIKTMKVYYFKPATGANVKLVPIGVAFLPPSNGGLT